MARKPVLKTTNLCKYYQMGKETVKANHKINMEVYAGEFVIIFGQSGCGKSTLMSLLAGLDEPTSGEILIRGEKLNGLNHKQLAKYRRTKIGMIFQQYNLIKTMSALENTALPLAFDSKPKRVRLKRAQDCLEMVSMGKYSKHTPAELSGGQQQRVAIARAWVGSPWIILADEPTGNLDSKSADSIMSLLKSLSVKSKRTVVLITHNPDYLKYADKVFFITDGVITKVQGKLKDSGSKSKKKANLNFLSVDDEIIKSLKKKKYKSAEDIINAKIADLMEVPGVDAVQAAKIQKDTAKYLGGGEDIQEEEIEENKKEEVLAKGK